MNFMSYCHSEFIASIFCKADICETARMACAKEVIKPSTGLAGWHTHNCQLNSETRHLRCKALRLCERSSAVRWARTSCPLARVTERHSAEPAARRRQHRSRRRQKCRALVVSSPTGQEPKVQAGSVSVVLLAGGIGKRMGASIPKQYLTLSGIPIAVHSLLMFASMPEVREIVIVCEAQFRPLFVDHIAEAVVRKSILFAQPGIERQDSVFSGLQAISSDAELVAIHDSARPLITAVDARRCMQDALQVGAAVLGVAVKPTIKQVDVAGRVVTTLQRAGLWEVQTPQVMRPALLRQGFQLVHSQNLAVTDDVSVVEALGLPVQVTPGSYTNIKVTTPDDLMVAEGLVKEKCAVSDQHLASLQPA